MELTVHGFLFMKDVDKPFPDFHPPYEWPGKIATIKLIRALHFAPSADTCPLLDAKYAAEYPKAALEYFERNKTLDGAYDDGNCLAIIKNRFPSLAGNNISLGKLLINSAISNDANLMAIIAKAIRKYGADYVVC